MLRILVVEDNHSNAEITALILENEGFSPVICQSATELFSLLEPLPAAILLDIQLPDGDGKMICRQLKSSPATSGIPVMLMTASYDTSEIASSFGAEDFIEKPFDLDLLLQKVRKLTKL